MKYSVSFETKEPITKCEDCPCLIENDNYPCIPWCGIAKIDLPDYTKSRPVDCPLIEVLE